MKGLSGACALLALLMPCASMGQACAPDLSGSRAVESARYTLAFRTQPEKVAVGRHFSVELRVCPKTGAAAPEIVKVDARMPEHRHGMNYNAQVVAAPGGLYRADGLMFHMPGRWEVVFDLSSGGRTDRLTQDLVLE